MLQSCCILTDDIYTWNLFVLYFGVWTLQKKAFSNQNRDHLGSRYTNTPFEIFSAFLPSLIGTHWQISSGWGDWRRRSPNPWGSRGFGSPSTSFRNIGVIPFLGNILILREWWFSKCHVSFRGYIWGFNSQTASSHTKCEVWLLPPKTYRKKHQTSRSMTGCLGSLILGIVWGGGIKQTANVSGQIMVNSKGSVPNIAKKNHV